MMYFGVNIVVKLERLKGDNSKIWKQNIKKKFDDLRKIELS